MVVDKAAMMVRIRGPDAECVARARAIMDFAVDRIPVSGGEVALLVGPGGATIRKIREDSRVINLEIDQVGWAPRGAWA